MFDEQPDGDQHGECAAEIHRLTDLVVEAHDQLHRLVATFVPGNDGAYTKTTDLMRRIREALPGVAFDGSASGAALPLAPQPQWICPRCKVDRSKEACPRGNGGNCPMVGSAHGVTACANCHANVAPEYRCKDCPNGVKEDQRG